MSNSTTNETKPFRSNETKPFRSNETKPFRSNETKPFRFRLPPAESQIVLGIGAGLLLVCAVQFKSFGFFQMLLMMAFFAIGIIWQRAWAIYLMLGTFIFLKYATDIPSINHASHRLRFGDLFLVLILILLTGACLKFLEIGRFSRSFYPDVKLSEKPQRGIRFEFPSLLGGRWWVIPLATLLASTLLVAFPFDTQPVSPVGIEPLASRLIFLTLFLFFGWFVCRALLGILIRWRMDARQADVHCRSLVAKELWKDVYGIEARREKGRSTK